MVKPLYRLSRLVASPGTPLMSPFTRFKEPCNPRVFPLNPVVSAVWRRTLIGKRIAQLYV